MVSQQPILLLPDELVLYLDNFLTIEDTIAFAQSYPRFGAALAKVFHSYNRMQLCDDHICFISNPKGRIRYFHLQNTRAILEYATNIEEILIIMKDVNIANCEVDAQARNMAEATPYTCGGYLGQIFWPIPPRLPNLKTVQIHIDVMFETFKEANPIVPTEDLFFALKHLHEGPFRTSVQVSFCCAVMSWAEDEVPRNRLFAGMERCLRAAADIGAETELEAEPGEGYVDIIIEKGKVDYSMAFFYYNPSICEPHDPNRTDIDMEEEEEGEEIDDESNHPLNQVVVLQAAQGAAEQAAAAFYEYNLDWDYDSLLQPLYNQCKR